MAHANAVRHDSETRDQIAPLTSGTEDTNPPRQPLPRSTELGRDYRPASPFVKQDEPELAVQARKDDGVRSACTEGKTLPNITAVRGVDQLGPYRVARLRRPDVQQT